MKVIGFDTATNWCSVGVVEDDGLLGEWTLKCKMTQLTTLIPGIKNLLEELNIALSDINCLAVTYGPGSFTGVRLGLVTAKTLSQVTGMSLVGINSLEAIVYQSPKTDALIVPLIDARKSQIYSGFYEWKNDEIIELRPSSLFYPHELTMELNRMNRKCYFTGVDIEQYKESIMEDITVSSQWAPSSHGIIKGSSVAYLGIKKISGGCKDNPLEILPLYIRPPDVKIKDKNKDLI